MLYYFNVSDPHTVAEIKDIEREFMAWHEAEQKRGLDWVEAMKKELPPKTLQRNTVQVPGGVLSQGPGFILNRWVIPPGWNLDLGVQFFADRFHPGAAVGIRKTGPDGRSGIQATYSWDGKIITGGLGVGTADLVTPEADVEDHVKADVKPFDWAYALDQYYGGQKFRQMYIDVRPPILPDRVTPNVVP